MPPSKPFLITASAAAPKREPWFSITASAQGAELRLRGYIGEPSTSQSWYDGSTIETGGMGTLKEFEDALAALGEVPLITVYLTSEGGDFPTAVAISSILARQKARIVCVIDGYAYSAAPVIACAADEVHAASNALIMIHDAEYWSAGCDVASLQEAIKTLEACNSSMAAAFQGKAGGTVEEWHARMVETTWLTGAQAAELKLVDKLLDNVSLAAYAPLKNVTAALRAPAEITALIDKSPPPTPTPSPSTMKPTAELIKAAAAFGIKLTAASTEKEVAAALTKIALKAEKKDEDDDEVTAEEEDDEEKDVTAEEEDDEEKDVTAEEDEEEKGKTTASKKTGKISAALAALKKKVTAQQKEINHLKGVKAHGIPEATAGASAPAAGTKKTEAPAKSNLGLVTSAWAPAKR